MSAGPDVTGVEEYAEKAGWDECCPACKAAYAVADRRPMSDAAERIRRLAECRPPTPATLGTDGVVLYRAVNALPALADLVEAVTLRHWPQDGRDCAECGDEWPCPTATALDALAAALEVA